MGVVAHSIETLARQNCATIVLHRQAAARTTNAAAAVINGRGSGLRFKCKSCDRAFETFQALGGHRASHKKLRLESGDAVRSSKKAHECRECRVGFQTGQALGGHMRKHVAKRKLEDDDDEKVEMKNKFPMIFGKSNRACLNLDLNFPPPLEDHSGFGFLQLAM